MPLADWQRDFADAAGDDAFAVFQRLRTLLPDLPDPQRGETDLRRFLAVAGLPATVAHRLHQETESLGLLLTLGGTSRYGFDLVIAEPGWFWEIVELRQYRQVWGRRTLAEHLRGELVQATDHDQRLAALARFKHRHFLRVILGDLSGSLGFESVVAELSDITDVLAQAACTLAAARFADRRGAHRVQFAVLGLGKLGGRELNYSSDIDLIFIYQDDDEGAGGEGGTGEWDCHAWCQAYGREIISVLGDSGAHGRMFRVDMRLRPEGDKGELALSARETLDYYYSVGRPWERQALIKARPIAGDQALGERVLKELRPWIFPHEHSWEGLDQTRHMRRRIEERAEDDNIKTGPGGIRDIEFLVQFFQLSFAGRIPELRDRATLPTLRQLADHGILPKDHARELERHYLWLRLVEHRLQIWDDRQLHELPAAAPERTALARRCGLRGDNVLAAFDERLGKLRARVRGLADHHYLRASTKSDAALALLVQEQPEPALVAGVLGAVGFKELQRAAVNLRMLATEPFFLLSRSRTQRSLAALLPQLLEAIKLSPNPDQTLENFAKIVGAVGGRATFFELLAGRPRVLRLFLDLAGWSTFMVNLLRDFPGLPDDLADNLNQPSRNAEVLLREARSLVRGLQHPAEALRYFQARELATAAVRDLEGLDHRLVCRQLTAVATAVLGVALERSVAERGHEWGLPVAGRRQSRFAVLGLGKLGSKELAYASDMDVIFVCDTGGSCLRNQRSGEEFWTKVAQELMRLLGEGQLYTIDPRLRPWGEGGELVANTQALTNYWREPKDLWERMAMLRVAHIGGDPGLGAESVTLIRNIALGAPLPANAAGEVRDMRRRLEESVAGRDHVKRGWGGYVDHEFIAHYRSFGARPDQLPAGATIEDTLRSLIALGRIPAEAEVPLIQGLRLLRIVESRMRLTAGKATSSLPTDPEQRTELAKRCNFPDLRLFDLNLHLARESARWWFERLIV